MSPGSEPERDDHGLPPVDVEIPDDARELDRDVQAYRRELRARRRQERKTRWHRSLGKDGIVLPLLACCLILALITGTLLTVFTATSEQGLTGVPGAGANSALSTGHGLGGPSPFRVAGAQLLPPETIAADGGGRIQLDELSHAMLVLVPAGCNCGDTLAWLADVAMSAGAKAYLIYDKQTKAEVERLYGQLPYPQHSALVPALDTAHALTRPATFPPGIPANQLAAVLVAPNRTVRYATGLSPTSGEGGQIEALIG